MVFEMVRVVERSKSHRPAVRTVLPRLKVSCTMVTKVTESDVAECRQIDVGRHDTEIPTPGNESATTTPWRAAEEMDVGRSIAEVLS